MVAGLQRGAGGLLESCGVFGLIRDRCKGRGGFTGDTGGNFHRYGENGGGVGGSCPRRPSPVTGSVTTGTSAHATLHRTRDCGGPTPSPRPLPHPTRLQGVPGKGEERCTGGEQKSQQQPGVPRGAGAALASRPPGKPGPVPRSGGGGHCSVSRNPSSGKF